jgi:DNA-binding beta-propeller fold protein YncE
VRRTIELVFADPTAGDSGATNQESKKLLLRPHGIAFTDDDHVVLTSEAAHRLALVHVGTGAIERTWTTPQTTMHMVALSPDRRLAHATSIQDGNVATFALGDDGHKPLSVVPTGDGAEGLAVNPATGEVWVGNRAANTVTVVEPKTQTAGDPIATADFPFRIAFTRDGKYALVSCAEGGDVQVFDAATKKLVRSISIAADGSELSAMPMGICVDQDGARAWVACGRGEFIAVLDLHEGKVVHKLRARAGADGIAFVRVPVAASGGAAVSR